VSKGRSRHKYEWVSIYFDRDEAKRLRRIMRRVRRRTGKRVTRYGLLKGWILRIFELIEKGDTSWLEVN